ncbi:MAG: fatty acid--CoA ligase [Thermodesulfobacteriota bacterium]
MPVRKIEKTSSAYDFPLLIKNILNSPLKYTPDREIVYRDQMRYDYKTMSSRVSRLANALEDLGLKQGETVGIMDWDSHRYLESFFAVPMMGAVLHTINIRLSPEQLIYTINHAEDDVILVNSEFLPLLEEIKDQMTTVKKLILLTDESQKPDTSLALDGEYEELLQKASDEYEFPDFSEDAMASLFYTTGTTGLPKGVYYSHRQLVLHTFGLMSTITGQNAGMRFDSSDVYMPITPMFHVHAWGMPYLATLLGAKQVYPGRYDPEMLLKLVLEEKVTFSHCVPTIIHMLVNNPIIEQIDLSGWKVIIGGSALPQGLCLQALKNNIDLITAYGLSETCPLLTSAMLKPHMLDWSYEEQAPIRCKTGIPAPNVEIRIVDPTGTHLPHDGVSTGEIVARAPWLTQGYLKDPEKSEELWQDGWLHTGDVGYVDTDGYVQITDRLKDVIKTGGEWLSSLKLEDIISRHEAVSEAAVVGIPDEKWGERPLARVVLKEDYKNQVTEDDLKEFFNQFVDNGTIPKYGIPNQIEIVESIPKTSVGKINKKEIRKNFS